MKLGKRSIAALLLVMTLITMSGFGSLADEAITIHVNGSELTSDVAPYINNDSRTMVELRSIVEALGAEVSWDETTRTERL